MQLSLIQKCGKPIRAIDIMMVNFVLVGVGLLLLLTPPFGQISNHYENEYWDEFHCEEKEFADEWDGHTEKDVLDRLHHSNKHLKD